MGTGRLRCMVPDGLWMGVGLDSKKTLVRIARQHTHKGVHMYQIALQLRVGCSLYKGVHMYQIAR